jgi:hypothetical protein
MGFPAGAEPMTDNSQDARRVCLRLCRALALPIYAIALIMSFLSDLLGTIAAKIVGDGWPRSPCVDSRKAAGESGFGGL